MFRMTLAPWTVALAACGLVAGCAPSVEFVGENEPATCSDGRDNDADGMLDCDDPDCEGLWMCSLERENTPTRCADGVDNDDDGWTDCEDAACIGLDQCEEMGDVQCSNGADDDFDGYEDCSDASCVGALPCLPLPPELCGNMLDDDMDGAADCMDPDCSGDPSCAGAPALMPGNCATHTFATSDPDTAALGPLYGVVETDLRDAMTTAKPFYGYYDFTAWGCRWFVVDVMVPAGGATVTAYYATEARDFMVVCTLDAPAQTLGDDDEDGTACTFLAQCGPWLDLATAGRWTCYFTVSPFDVIGNGNSPTDGVLVGCVD